MNAYEAEADHACLEGVRMFACVIVRLDIVDGGGGKARVVQRIIDYVMYSKRKSRHMAIFWGNWGKAIAAARVQR